MTTQSGAVLRDRLPPGPAEIPDEQARRWMEDPCELLEACHKRFGDLFTLRLGSFGTIVIVADPEGVKQVFEAKADDFECRHFNASYRYAMGDNALFLQDGTDHRRLKGALAPAFSPGALQQHAATIARFVDESIAQWPDRGTIRVRPAMHELTLTCLLALCLGESVALRGEIVNWFRERVWTDLRSWKPWTAQSRLRPAIGAALSGEMARLRSTPSGRAVPNLMELMLDVRDAHGVPLEDAVIHDQITMLMITAGDAVAVAVSWALCRAALHGDIQLTLQGEHGASCGADLPVEPLRRPLLAAFIREVLRLHPVLPTVSGRRLIKQRTFLGYELPVGVTLAPCQYLVHRRDDIFVEPLAFRPSRFDGRAYPRQSYFPFGGSERACLGNWLAPMSIAIVTDIILARFVLHLPEGAIPRTVRHGTLLAPDPKFALAVRRRGP